MMIKPIKFRCWDGYTMAFFRIGAKNPLPGDKNLSWLTDQEVMQSSGLLDKNGYEIYEGDIVLNGRQGKFEVYFDTKTAGFRLKRASKNGLLNPNNNEIIGNIYEDPELLK